MPSLLAWVDVSTDEQRRIREIIAMFQQTESRDELGVGQVRDAFSDMLVPGTSVIQTRARYFLFIPWIFRDGARRGHAGQQLRGWADRWERRLIVTLLKGDDQVGLIGGHVGPGVKTLPSTIYWSGLRRFGILTRDVPPDQLVAVLTASRSEADELDVRHIGDWHPTLPPAPIGFPDAVAEGFTLARDEALWLRERVLATCPGTLLAHLLTRDGPPSATSDAPWNDPGCVDVSEPAGGILHHARMFSLAMHGAALLYNLLVAERYEAARYTRVPTPVETYRERLGDWEGECRRAATELQGWPRDAMWALVARTNPRISPITRVFVDTWLDAVCTGEGSVADDEGLRAHVARRERTQKRKQSRFDNDGLLRAWSGESGSARLTYRWPTVRRLVTDVHEGLGHDARP
jgi:hypothetical protein